MADLFFARGPAHACQDPELRKRVSVVLVGIAITTLTRSTKFASIVLEYIFADVLEDESASPAYGEALRALQAIRPLEAQKLARRFANQFWVSGLSEPVDTCN